MDLSRKYNKLSIAFASAGLVMLFLVLRELPNNDGANGTYINMLLELSVSGSGDAHQMRALDPLSLTEHRVLSLVYIGIILFSVMSIIFGLIGRYRKEASMPHASSIAISSMLLITSYQYKLVFLW